MNAKLPESQDLEEDISLSKLPWAWYPGLGLVAGIAVLGQLYMQASQSQVTFLFERFWLGMFLFYIPTFWRLLSTRVSRSERLVLLIGVALFSYVPKLFRCPYYFCYSDELTWWRGVQNLLRGGAVLSNNPLGLIQGAFPGLPLLTIVLQKVSGLSTFQGGLALMGVMRLFTLISIFLLGEKIFNSSRVGAIAALVYTMNANFLFFSSQFSYESLAVPLLIATLLFLQYLFQADQDRAGIAWLIVVLISISAIVVTHHLATYMMIAIFISMTVLAKLISRFTQQKIPPQLAWITVFAVVTGGGWLYFTHTNVVEYLGDPISRGFEQIAFRVMRRLFSGISLPWYEVASGYLSAILIALLAVFGAFIILRKRKALQATQVGLLAFGSLYFIAAPLVLTPWGAESGRRSWVYSFISLALLSGFVLTWLVSSDADSMGNRRIGILPRRIGATLALCVLLLGGVATSTSISYRFPGEYMQNSDARSYTPEIIDAAQWLFTQAGANNRVLGDRTTERIFGSYGLQHPAMYGGPRPWEVFFPTSWTSDALYWLENARAPFIVVDKRLAELPPQMDFRFQRDEPASSFSDKPLPAGSVEKYDGLSRLDRIYDSGNIRIYYLNDAGQSVFRAGISTEYAPLQNPIETGFASASPANSFLNMFAVFFSCLFLVAFLVISGYAIGYLFFPGWSGIEVATRITLAVSISISLVMLSTFILALFLPSVEKAATVDLILLGFLLIIGLIRLVEQSLKNRVGKLNLLPQKLFTGRVWLQDSIWIYVSGLISILLVIFLMGRIEPRFEPRTDLVLDFSSTTPGVRIANHEEGTKDYQLIVHGEGTGASDSKRIHLDANQSVRVDLGPSLQSLPAKGRLYLDLYIEGQETPYRSLHFIQEEMPEASQVNLKGSQ